MISRNLAQSLDINRVIRKRAFGGVDLCAG
jgi:hypothetical protein